MTHAIHFTSGNFAAAARTVNQPRCRFPSNMRRLVVVSMLVACGGGARVGKIVTEITASESNPALLLVKQCDLVTTGKGNLDQIAVGDCKRFGVRRSPIVPVPVAEGRVLQTEHRIVTGVIERKGGGATVTTCKLGQNGNKQWTLLDCADTDIATALLEAP